MVSSPRIDFNSLWILKGDLSATFADPFELITINILNGDQPAKGDTLIRVGRSSAFLLLATEAAPRAVSVQGFFATSGCGIHPSPHTGRTSRQTVGVGLSIIPNTGGLRWIELEDSMRRSGRDYSAGKEVRIEDKARWRERDVAHVPERGSSWATP
ncbi:hypothetical protein PoB_004022700 [Plakobranchus ocellatus]|uniref:Uncharacterized protein n=1 Tax=Plakobranchus ocellatus TaxID=259542 RepID=A0AAV4B3C1_9GAST|nr:hypothetical protein PoB_004022700 [Plakobranchus ocellatus]